MDKTGSQSITAKYYPGDNIKKNEMGTACRMYARKKWCIDEFRGKSEGKGLPVRPRRRWTYNIKMHLQYIKCVRGMD
jgi:hypothetical protein